MEVHLTPEVEAKLKDSASQQGRDANEVVQDALAQYLDEEAHFVEAMRIGEAQLDKGEYLTHEQVGRMLAQYLQP